MIRTDGDGRVYFQWLGNNKYTVKGQFEAGWKMKCDTIYYQDEPRRYTHVPYYETDMLVYQDNILCHSFQLTADKRLPEKLIDFARTHEDIWWPNERTQEQKD